MWYYKLIYWLFGIQFINRQAHGYYNHQCQPTTFTSEKTKIKNSLGDTMMYGVMCH